MSRPAGTLREEVPVLDPETLLSVEPEADVPPGLVLLEALDGFVDAGGAGRLARQHLLETLDARVVATFDVDQLLDYRARRPPLVFDGDHWASYEPPRLAVHLVSGAAGGEFLLLTGPEPDQQWERFTAAVRLLVERLEVRLTVGLHSIPLAVPHTRPVGLTAHATRRALVEMYEPWPGPVRVPGSAAALLQLRLGQAGHDAMGFAAHVPQYLASSDLPGTAAVLLDAVARATGLTLPTDALREAGEAATRTVDEQVGESAELSEAVAGLERQYDAFMAGRAREQGLLVEDAPLPTAEELGDELEEFLRGQGG